MSIKYDARRETLAEIIKKSTINATYVIPDLQRPYVWTPRQVIMLIDSLFRGWPFGSLLLWEVKPDCFSENEGIPHRPFWQVVDRTRSDMDTKASPLGQPATYQMILDGQQRVQSLILALGGDQWGFTLFDYEWALDLRERRVKQSEHWSKGSLCIDLNKFNEEFHAKDKKVRKIEVGKILEWAILDATSGQSAGTRPGGYLAPLLKAKDEPGRFIRLSRFWEMVQVGLSESEYEEILKPMLDEHLVPANEREELLRPLSQFMRIVENVKTNSFVHALQIESFEVTPQWSKDDYSDAIVNIFTRLNTAGRTLTREEITLAWLKIGWDQKQTDGKNAGQCLEALRQGFSDRGFHLETDEMVRLISFVWAVDKNDGKLLDSKDLLKGDIVRSMAGFVANAWKRLESRMENGADLIKRRDLIENHGSFNSVIVFLVWYRTVFDKFESLPGTVVDRDRLSKKLEEKTAQFLDRWLLASQWAGVWGEAAVINFQNFSNDLHSFKNEVGNCGVDDFLEVVDGGVSQLMGRIIGKATESVNNVLVRDRKRVHAYFPFLWVWHRLDDVRWQNSSIQMRTGRKRTSKLEVDHTIADAWWKAMIEDLMAVKLQSFVGTDEEKIKIAPDGFESTKEAIEFINLLGNCSLLDKSFNISKSKHPMWDFLKDVHEFIEGKVKRDEWEMALSLSPVMTTPNGIELKILVDAIKMRESLMKRELVEFVAGSKNRVDVL
jgi:hypothetical protein